VHIDNHKARGPPCPNKTLCASAPRPVNSRGHNIKPVRGHPKKF
jgi:hypothetical protein